MLMLAGLMGVMMMGAAFVGGLETDTEETEGDDDAAPELKDEAPVGDLGTLLIEADAPGAAPADPTPTAEALSEPAADAGPPAIEGTETADRLIGGDGGERIFGLGGNDELGGGGGDDLIDAGSGEDIVHGGAGNDSVLAGQGEDTVFGHDEDDDLHGEDGDDHLFGGLGDDDLSGGAGDDSLVGGSGQDALAGDTGDDSLEGMSGDDSLSGGLGEDVLFGGYGADSLDGRVLDKAGTDVDAPDFLNGETGDDTIFAGQGDHVSLGSGADTLFVGDWIEGENATLSDYDPAEDNLVVVFDDSAGSAPHLALQASDADPDAAVLTLDGHPILTVNNGAGLSLDDVSLVPQSALIDVQGGAGTDR
ncbi:MAG: calcium-binding protein [Pseudomonadota bacterium]